MYSPVAQGLGDVCAHHAVGGVEIGQGPGDLAHPIVAASRLAMFFGYIP